METNNENHTKDGICKDGSFLGVAHGRCPGDRHGRSDRKEGDLALRDPLHFPVLQSLEVPGLGTATLLEALGTTQNITGEKMFDKMSARCTALSVDSGSKKYIDGGARSPSFLSDRP